MGLQDEMDLLEQYAGEDPFEELEQEEQEENLRYARERRKRIERRRRREMMQQRRIRRIRLTAISILAVILLTAVFVRVAVGDPVRDSLTLQVGSAMPEARAFLRNAKSRSEIYFLSDMTQVDMNTAGETVILLEVDGKQYESRLIVKNPQGAEEDTESSESSESSESADSAASAASADSCVLSVSSSA